MYKSKGLKNITIQKVKDYFIEYKIATKNDIVKETALSTATITYVLKELLDEHYIERIEDMASTGGRKAKCYKLCGHYMYFALLDLQVLNNLVQTSIKIVDLDYQIVYKKKRNFKSLNMDDLILIIDKARETYSFHYLGISIPGIVEDGFISKCDIEEFEDFDLKDQLNKRTNLKIVIENDVNTAMLGYNYSHSIENKIVSFIYQPDNHHSGCGLSIHNEVIYGATHFAGELAYLPNGTLVDQEKMLKEYPLELLIKQVVSVITIVNPAYMILYTPLVKEEDFHELIIDFIPKKHLPRFLFIDSVDEYIFKGLLYKCIQESRYKKKEIRKDDELY